MDTENLINKDTFIVSQYHGKSQKSFNFVHFMSVVTWESPVAHTIPGGLMTNRCLSKPSSRIFHIPSTFYVLFATVFER